jgi:hypothetical protein
MPPSIRSIVLALVLGALLVPSAAQASPTQMSIMMDDDLLVYRDDSTAARTLTQMKSLGVDTIRVTLLWKTAAEFAKFTKADLAKLKGKQLQRLRERARRQNKRFKPTNSSTYPIRNWDRYDNLVREATKQGIRVYFNVTGPGPKWAHEIKPKKSKAPQSTYKPKARDFKQFVIAVGSRFDGTHRDENGSRAVLPRVSMWSLWNEPNQGGWLSPQWERRGGALVPASPSIYRKLYQSGYQALVATGHRVDNDIILLGETAPLGGDAKSGKSPIRPKQFLRELFCIGADGAPYTGAAAKARECGSVAGGLQANGFAHHPYTKNLPPTQRDANPDALTMANISELGGLLDELAAKTSAVPAGLPLYMTEYGFETNPPDPFSGIPLQTQAQFNVLGEFMAWANPRIASQAQFLLADVAPVRNASRNSKGYWFTYQSGLFFQRGLPKPAAFAYAFPFRTQFTGALEEATGNPIFTFWGQLRFLPNGAPESVQIQWRPKDGSADWATVGDPVAIDHFGYFTAIRTAPAPVIGDWRGAWVRPDGSIGSTSLAADGSGA